MKIKKEILLFFLIIDICFFLIKARFMFLPLHNDEFNHMEGVEKIVKNNFWPFVEWWSYHPPLVYEVVALIVSFVSKNNWVFVSHLVIAIFSFSVLIFTYFLGKEIFDEKVALLATLLLFFLPLFQSQSSLFHLAVPLTLFFLMSFYFWLKEKWSLYLLFSSFLILTKETGAVIVLILGLFDFLINVNRGFRNAVKRGIIINLPQLLLGAWMLLNKKFLGWYLWPFNVGLFTENRRIWGVESFGELLKTNFLDNGVWILTAGIILGSIASFWNREVRNIFIKKESFFTIFLSLFFFLFFYYGVYLPRYTLFTLPLLIIILAALINEILKINRLLGFLSLGAVIVIFSLNWFHFSNRRIRWNGEENYGYVNIVRNHKKVVDFVVANFPTVKVATHYPLDVSFAWPLADYNRDKEVGLTKIKDFTFEEAASFKGIIVISDLYIRHAGEIGERLPDLERLDRVRRVKVIRDRGIKTWIYEAI